MPLTGPLERFLDLNRHSREFHIKLAEILLKEDLSQAQDLQGYELISFVKGLDRGLDVFDPAEDAFYRCLFELRRVCGVRGVLPPSHILSGARVKVGNNVVSSGVTADTYEGLLDRLKVRVKKVRVYSVNDQEKHKLFYHEAVMWKRIRHRNVVHFHGATLDPHQLVSDWMEGGSLTGFLEGHPNANRVGLLNDVAEGLNYLHSRNVIHGGISGAHILVDQFGRALVGDFAFATIDQSRAAPQGASRNAIVVENLPARWTAPEVLEGERSLTKMSDVFSFAMVMYEVFAGEVPFKGLPLPASFMELKSGKRPTRQTKWLLTCDVWELMNKCWDQEARSRPEMSTVLKELTPILLRTLRQSHEPLPEFQTALSQFHDSSERESLIKTLHDVELKDFIHFLDGVLRIEELGEDSRQQTLHILREVCEQKAVLPDSCLVPRQISKPTTGFFVGPNECTEVWQGKTEPGEGSGATMDVCVKAIKSKAPKEFYGDVALWVKLEHPNIVKCFGMSCNPLQIVTEWMPGGQAIIYAQKNLEPPDRVSLLIDIARGLEYLHSCGVTHGNLKQENILLDSEKNARLSDIGFSRLTPIGESKFDWAQTSGEGCRWAAPEIFQKGEFTKQSDVFSYGFIAAEIFLGKCIWEGSDAMQMRSKILENRRPSPPQHEEGYNPVVVLWRMFAQCWENDPASRMPLSEALRVLEHIPFDSSYLLRKVADQGKGKSGQALIDQLDEILDACIGFSNERPATLIRLCDECEREGRLPESMIIPYESLGIGSTFPAVHGGFGDVYQGDYCGHKAAVKVMRLQISSNLEDFLSKFCREAVTSRHLRHPNVLPLFGAVFDRQASKFALVSRWMVNGNINNFIKNNRDVNRVQLLVDVAHGLQYLHRLNLVHGDLKGANILIKDDHRACLADFGSSTMAHVKPRVSDDSTTQPSGVFMNPETAPMPHSHEGTDRWMSPELLVPEQFEISDTRPTKQSDCYALGMVIYEVLCGKPPYWDLKSNVVCAIIEGRKPSKPEEAAELGFTDGLWWIVGCCWLRDRAMRPNLGKVLLRLTDAAWAWEMRRQPTRTPPSSS